VEFVGKIAVLKDNDLGQIGVMRMLCTLGWTIGPPADNEYAVDPVGVATINLYTHKINICVSILLYPIPYPSAYLL
jgi:hypothetical protein